MPPRPRYSREDWIALGRSAQEVDGAEALRLDAICKRAGLSKGSFYHHFSDHTAFLEGVVDSWAAEALALLDAPEASEMFLAPALEEGIRALAPRAPVLATLVADVEAERSQSLANRYVDRFEVPWPRALQLAALELAVLRGGGLRDPSLAALFAKMSARYLRPDPKPKARPRENEAQASLFPLTP